MPFSPNTASAKLLFAVTGVALPGAADDDAAELMLGAALVVGAALDDVGAVGGLLVCVVEPLPLQLANKIAAALAAIVERMPS